MRSKPTKREAKETYQRYAKGRRLILMAAADLLSFSTMDYEYDKMYRVIDKAIIVTDKVMSKFIKKVSE